jgi:hypothetical protein
MITYDQFLANAEAEDIRVLNLLSQGQEIKFNDGAEADAMFQRIVRLDSAGFVLRVTRAYFRIDGMLWQSFTALIDPVASTYLAQAAAERVQLSRLPLPA